MTARSDPETDPNPSVPAGPTLGREIKKRQPFEMPEQEALLNLLRTADLLALRFARLFRGHGLSMPQYNVLRILRGEGGVGLPSLEVAARLVTPVPDITRLIDRLEDARLVERDRSAADRRVVLIRITPRGLERLQQLDEPVMELHRRVLGHLSPDELAGLNRLLVKARHPDPDTGAVPPAGPADSAG